MSGVPRSQRLIGYKSTAGVPSPVWFSPQNFITLVKTISVNNQGTAISSVSVVVSTNDGTVTVNVVNETVEPGAALERSVWLALNPTDAVYCIAELSDVTFWVSGAVLAGPPQFPPASRKLPAQQPDGGERPQPIEVVLD